MLPLLLALSAAQAQDCDVRGLEGALAEASPSMVPLAFGRLAECDPSAADALAATTLPRALAGSDAGPLLTSAVRVGAHDEVRAWIDGQPSDERSSSIKLLGKACGEDPAVAAFLVESASVLGNVFWNQRWYRSLTECRTPEIQALLLEQVQTPSSDRSRFLGTLEVFARNLGKDALPYLKTLVITGEREEDLTYIVNAFADAAQVGSLDGADAETAALAVTALFELAPHLPDQALTQAATTLVALGAGDRAGDLAGAHFRDRIWEDGKLHYGLVVSESAVCKKGKLQVVLHTTEVTEAGHDWMANLRPQVDAAMEAWTFELADDCKGQAREREVFLSPEPLLDPADLDGYQQAIRRQVEQSSPSKIEVVEETLVAL